jgi:hypothetical protein
MIREKLGSKADTILTPRVLEGLKTEFENGIKRNFDDESREDYEIEMGRAPDIPEIGLEDGVLALSS